MNSYELSRSWFDFCFENPDKIKPAHTAVFFFAIEHCNRLGWKEKFGFPTTMVMEAIGIKSYTTYISVLNDIVDWGYIKMIERSKNQYSANIIALSKNDKAVVKALDKALIKHKVKQVQSTSQSIVSIDKQTNKEQTNKLTIEQRVEEFVNSLYPYIEEYGKDMLNDFYLYWTEHGDGDKKMRFEKEKTFGLSRRLTTWKKNDKKFNNNGKGKQTITGAIHERFKDDPDYKAM